MARIYVVARADDEDFRGRAAWYRLVRAARPTDHLVVTSFWSSRGVYVIAALIAASPLLVLGYAAPGGESWRWLEYPRYLTIVALVLGLIVVHRRNAQLALMVPLATVAVAVIAELRDGGRDPAGDIASVLQTVAPWLVGSLYGVLAFLGIRRPRSARAPSRSAGAWLLVVGAIALAITFANESWLIFASSEHHVRRSSSPWPDTQVFSVVVAMIAIAAGLLLAIGGAALAARAKSGDA